MATENQIYKDKFQAYNMDKQGNYYNPVTIGSSDELSTYLKENVEKYHELRVVSKDDTIAFHVIDRVLIFPIMPGMAKNNKWNPETKKFQTVN